MRSEGGPDSAGTDDEGEEAAMQRVGRAEHGHRLELEGEGREFWC